MDNNVANSQKTKAVSITLREDILAEMDNWLEKKEKETGGKFTRSGFIEKAVIDRIKEYGLAEGKQK